jgi:Tol biopolymer transport system component
MTTRTIVSDGAVDRDAHWSPDGTRLAFIRVTSAGQTVVISDVDGRVHAITDPFSETDPDSIAWSPDGRLVAVGGRHGAQPGVFLIDAASGVVRELRIPYGGLEVYWRPPDGTEVLFRIKDNRGGGLGIASVADGRFERIEHGPEDPYALRPLGWTPDGRAILYQADDTDAPRTVVLDVESGLRTELEVGFGHVSNDGQRVAGVDRYGRFCVSSIRGGECRVIDGAVHVSGTHGAGVRWSPDDRWIAMSTNPVWLVDPTNTVPPRAIANGGPGSWQRIAP